MEKEIYTTKDIIRNNKCANICISENYQFTKKFKSVLNKPRFSIKKSRLFINDLTYKKINDWDKKNVISGDRSNKEAGWRKFSIIDILKLYIISDLRKLGFDIKKIRVILKNISDFTFEAISLPNNKLKDFPFLLLEYFFLECINGYKNFLIISENGEIYFFQEDDLFAIHFYLDGAGAPIIILPFFKYVKKTAEKVNLKKVNYDNDPKVYELFRTLPKERKILDIIDNKKYETITITKKNGNILTIKAKEIKRGDFSDKEIINTIKQKDYQNVSVSVKDGKKINITREESIKL